MDNQTQNEICNIEMRSLILEALAIEDETKVPYGQTFKKYGYKGTINDLLQIIEYRAIENGLINQIIPNYQKAWASSHRNYYTGSTTNFSSDNLNTFFEEFYFLLHQNIISPFAYGDFGESLPYFHVTKYGMECLANREILPYDSEGYLNKIKSITSMNDWEVYYIEQSLQCYNCGALEASTIMLGLASEYLISSLIEGMLGFVKSKENSKYNQWKTSFEACSTISDKFNLYERKLEILEKLKLNGVRKYQDLFDLRPKLDVSARPIYATFLRLTRNGLAHPARQKIDKIDCLTLLTTFIKYTETQHQYLEFYLNNK